MIQDMSYLHTPSGVTSVNQGIDLDAFPTAWGSFDATTALILSIPTGCVAATFDISPQSDQISNTTFAYSGRAWYMSGDTGGSADVSKYPREHLE
jgi:hypothetical protein